MHIKRFTSGICHANSYIVSSEVNGASVMVDSCGCNEKIIKFLSDNNLSLKAILLTHGHFDHIDGIREIKNITGADICIFSHEEKFLSDTSFNLSEDSSFLINAAKKADVLLNDGDSLSYLDEDIKVIHTPGHTFGSVCYLIDDSLFTGDTLFKSSIGRFDFPTGDGNTEIKSIKEKLLSLEDEIKVYPGHGFTTTIGRERKENPYLCG